MHGGGLQLWCIGTTPLGDTVRVRVRVRVSESSCPPPPSRRAARRMQVPIRLVTGRVFMRVWPPSGAGFLANQYPPPSTKTPVRY
jgi:hypothetical protein